MVTETSAGNATKAGTAKAYAAGWDASKQTTTYDMDTAGTRYIDRHGATYHDAWCAGWSDHAADNDHGATYGRALTYAQDRILG